ncbi:glycosyltransferase [Paraflavisolibacter sp. H34]|uniref:glycosyltransferase n=1 Tax=Huijunlia imazamoxiresistens TaxID=3127457 RepID=UPI003017BC0B
MSRTVHVVCLDAPAPPDYGGAQDMYHKVVALAEAGCAVHLHYFAYRPGRDAAPLAPYCRQITAYPRRTGPGGLSPRLPYIVSSRINAQLVQNLNRDDHPLLLEGLHCTGLLPFLENRQRPIVVRMHNDEERYYHFLAKAEQNPLKKLYYSWESRRLKAYQQRLDPALTYACLSQRDVQTFRETYGLPHTVFLPSFLPWQTVSGPEGRGAYCLYHGNLEVAENEKAAAWLVEEVFSKMELPLVIAGKGAGHRLQRLVRPHRHLRLVRDPSDSELETLLRDAHLHVLPSFNETGVKLKLLHALYSGKFCLTNEAGAAGSGLEGGLDIFRDAPSCIEQVQQLWARPFTGTEKAQRATLLALYHNGTNAGKLIGLW